MHNQLINDVATGQRKFHKHRPTLYFLSNDLPSDHLYDQVINANLSNALDAWQCGGEYPFVMLDQYLYAGEAGG